MKILLAGSSGAIGQPLIRFLVQAGHEVFGITQSSTRASLISDKGGHPVILNVLDRPAVTTAMEKIQPEIVIDMLTHLPKKYTPQAMRDAAEMDAKIRHEGGANLQAAAEEQGVKRYLVQSAGFWYTPGVGLADENVPFAFHATPGIAAGSHLYAEIENRVLKSPKIEGVALRFGFFYGPGTWFQPQGNMGDQVRAQQFPLIGESRGIWNFVHIEDAAQAVVKALQCPPGVYNIVNDTPTPLCDWLPIFARYVKAPTPPHLTEEEGLAQRGPDSVYYATKLRGASNAKAKRTLGFYPRPLEWL